MTIMNTTDSIDELKSKLFSVDEKTYGKDYKKHLLEQYKLCVEMADKTSARRSTANNFFLSANTLLLTAIGILSKLGSDFLTLSHSWLSITSIAGILFCWAWIVTIRCYRDLNTAKFKIINAIEEKLPIAPFDVEWVLLNPEYKSHKYPQLTRIERWVPGIFIGLYLVLMLFGIGPFLLQLLDITN